MEIESSAVVNIDDNIRLVGTAHISRSSADLVKEQIADFEPDIVSLTFPLIVTVSFNGNIFLI